MSLHLLCLRLYYMNFFKFISFFYLLILSIALLIPLDFFLVTAVVEPENHPSSKFALILHFVLFFFLYTLFRYSFYNRGIVLYSCVIYAVITEFIQLFTSRGFQISDMIFNLLGILFSFLLFVFLEKIRNSLKNWWKYQSSF